MKINVHALNIALARKCMSFRQLRADISPQTLTKMKKGEVIKPATVGKLAKALGVDVLDIIESEARQ